MLWYCAIVLQSYWKPGSNLEFEVKFMLIPCSLRFFASVYADSHLLCQITELYIVQGEPASKMKAESVL